MIIQEFSKATVCITLNYSYIIDLNNNEYYLQHVELNQDWGNFDKQGQANDSIVTIRRNVLPHLCVRQFKFWT